MAVDQSPSERAWAVAYAERRSCHRRLAALCKCWTFSFYVF